MSKSQNTKHKSQIIKLDRISFQDVVPFAAFFIIFLFFVIASYNERTGTIRMLTAYNLNLILEQSMLTIIAGCGAMFVIAQGSTDLSVGVNLALSGVIATWFALVTGVPVLLFPVALIVGLAVGLFNGVIVSKYKVPSFMVTIAMLMGVRGLVNYIQTKLQSQRIPESLLFLNSPFIKIGVFLVVVAVMAYVFEFTKTGRYSRAIGENETAAKFVGIPVGRVKLVAFALSGLLSGVAALFSLVTIGSTSQQMGVFLEMRVVMAIYLGGVLVTGGSSAKFYKLILGSLSITIIINGLALISMSDSHISQSVQGVLLLLILILSMVMGNRKRRTKTDDA